LSRPIAFVTEKKGEFFFEGRGLGFEQQCTLCTFPNGCVFDLLIQIALPLLKVVKNLLSCRTCTLAKFRGSEAVRNSLLALFLERVKHDRDFNLQPKAHKAPGMEANSS
jgi:hypothetical protein